MRMNTRINAPKITTHEGARAARLKPEQELRRSIMASLLWEDTFYESGVEISKRIADLIPKVSPDAVFQMAVEAREKMKLRHMPLFIAREMARLDTHKAAVAELLAKIIQRPDELAEFLAIYWKDGRQPVSAQVKKGIAKAFVKFDEYRLAKYNTDSTVKLRDALFISHAKPESDEQAALWRRLVKGTLVVPDTWEVALSSGADKKATFERLIAEQKLGALALLRNLRNMDDAGVDEKIIAGALVTMKAERVLPFRFISAAKYAPKHEQFIEQAMLKCLEGFEKLPGKTVLVIDGSGSMDATVSDKSNINRLDAAAALGILIREVCEQSVVIVFSENAYIVPARHGFALRDVIHKKAEHSGTNTRTALDLAEKQGYDRIIVVTDEQSHQDVGNPLPGTKGYFINVASYQNGIGYGAWTHIDGWSESVLNYIAASEKGAE